MDELITRIIVQIRTDGKIVLVRTLHRIHNPHIGKTFPHWSDSHEHHVNEGNQMGDHRHLDMDFRESHEFYKRRQALADGKPAPVLPTPAATAPLSPVREVRFPVMVHGHKKHKHWYNRKEHFSDSHEHHVFKGNGMPPQTQLG